MSWAEWLIAAVIVAIVAMLVAVGVHQANREYILTVESAVGVPAGTYRLDGWNHFDDGTHCRTTDGRTIVLTGGVYRITDATKE